MDVNVSKDESSVLKNQTVIAVFGKNETKVSFIVMINGDKVKLLIEQRAACGV